MQDDDEPYLWAEVRRFRHELPKRGLLCSKCGTRIPQFATLSDRDAAWIGSLIAEKSAFEAIEELCAITGCSLAWAKIWVQHNGVPDPDWVLPPCPFCGQLLRTPAAQQCRHCFREWHGIASNRDLD